MNKIKLFIASLITAIGFTVSSSPMLIMAAPNPTVDTSPSKNLNCGAAGDLSGTGNCGDTSEGTDTVNRTVKIVIQTFQIIVGLISVFMIIFGGLKYVTSGGNDAGVKSAKNTLLYAVIGLVIVVIAQAVVQFVLNRFASA